jgi:hypothetical protein
MPAGFIVLGGGVVGWVGTGACGFGPVGPGLTLGVLTGGVVTGVAGGFVVGWLPWTGAVTEGFGEGVLAVPPSSPPEQPNSQPHAHSASAHPRIKFELPTLRLHRKGDPALGAPNRSEMAAGDQP